MAFEKDLADILLKNHYQVRNFIYIILRHLSGPVANAVAVSILNSFLVLCAAQGLSLVVFVCALCAAAFANEHPCFIQIP